MGTNKSLSFVFFILFFIFYVQGYAIVDKSNNALTVSKIEDGAALSLLPFDREEDLADNQNWIAEDGYIRLKFYSNFVICVKEHNPVLCDEKKLTTTNARWSITASGGLYQIQSTSKSSVRSSDPFSGFWSFVDPFLTYDYIIAGAGTAGCKVAKELSDDMKTSVLSIEAGKRVDDNPLVQAAKNIRAVEGTATFNFQYYSERIANLGSVKAPAGVGKMWGGTSNHNGMLYDRGLKYDWDVMKKLGGNNWDYDTYILKEYLRQENYTGTKADGYGVGGSISIVDSVNVPAYVSGNLVNATTQVYPAFAAAQGLLNLTGSTTTLQLTMTDYGNSRYIRESSSTAYFHSGVVTPQGEGVATRKLQVASEAYVTRILFHPLFPKVAIGVLYTDKSGESKRVYVNKEVILSAGVYGSPAILMRSGVGNCSELADHNISCVENNVYVGSNLQDHMRVQVEITVPLSNALAVAANANALNSDGHILEGRVLTNLSSAYTDYSVSNVTQPDTKMTYLVFPQIPYAELSTIYNLNWLDTFTLPAIFEIAAVLLRPKCTGKITLSSSNPAVYPVIASNYLCQQDDLNWSRLMFRDLMKIADNLHAIDGNYTAIYPKKSDIDTDAKLERWVRGFTTSYRHPSSTLRVAPRDDVNQGVVDGNLCVYGIKGVRVVDASVFPNVPSANPQASVYALTGRAVNLIKDPTKSCRTLF